MAENIEQKDIQKEIEIGHIINFIKKCWGRIVCFAIFSFCVAFCVIAIAYFLLPRNVNYVSTIHLQLPKIHEVRSYPNGKRFSSNDILSVSVMKKVYDNHNLAGKIKFEDFRKLFSLSGLDIDRAKISASYKEKLNNKKLSVIELKELETEYRNELQQLDAGTVCISMTPDMIFTEHEMTKILNEIPRVWFEIYSKQEAKIFPEIETVALISDLQQKLNQEGKMLSFDKARSICNNLNRVCSSLEEMTAGTKMSLPTGEFLSDLQKRLSNFTSQRIQTLLLIIREMPEYQHPLDKITITARIMDLDKKIKLEKAKYDATILAVDVLTANKIAEGNLPTRKGDTAMSNFTLDNDFLTSLEALIRKALATDVRERYTEKALQHKMEIARLESEKEYYAMMFRKNTDQSIFKTVDSKQLAQLEKAMFTELLDLCDKINKFRDMVFKDYVQDRGFYSTSGMVEKLSQFYIPFSRVALGIIALVALLNVIYVAKTFYASHSKGLLDN